MQNETLRLIKNAFKILLKFSETHFFELPFAIPLWLSYQFPRYSVPLFQNGSLWKNPNMSLIRLKMNLNRTYVHMNDFGSMQTHFDIGTRQLRNC